ncbi:MAG: 1-acyl-sn-glycerol-3-phosphate acyltransferase [Desulfotalea sp.]
MSKFPIKKIRLLALVIVLLSVVLVIAPLAITSFPYFYFIKRDPIDIIARFWVWVYGKSYVFCTKPFFPATLSWQDNKPYSLPKGSVIIMNHYSVLDLYYLGLMPTAQDANIAFVTQKRPSLVKLYAPFMAAGKYIDMRREGLASCEKLCAEHLAKGNHVLFFPEGGRNRGVELNKFKSTPFYVANKNNAPIVPICIYGTNHLLPPKAKGLNLARIQFHIMQPVLTDNIQDELGHRILKKAVHREMGHVLAKFHADYEGK